MSKKVDYRFIKGDEICYKLIFEDLMNNKEEIKVIASDLAIKVIDLLISDNTKEILNELNSLLKIFK